MKFSIITVNLNNCIGLFKTIESVVNQTCTDFEYIVIDGESGDGSKEVIEFFRSKITFWVSEKDAGIYNAMNKGIRQAKGEYLLFLNSGDFLVNRDVIKNVNDKELFADILLGDCNVSQKGVVVHKSTPPEELTIRNFINQTIPHQSTFIRRKLFDFYGMYTESYKIHGDFEFWIRTMIIKNCSAQRLGLLISDYNLEGLSSQKDNESLFGKEIENILKENIPDRILIDIYRNYEESLSLKHVNWFLNKAYREKVIRLSYKTAYGLTKSLAAIKRPVIHICGITLKGISLIKLEIIESIKLLKFFWKLYRRKPVIIIAWHQVSKTFNKELHNRQDWTSMADLERSIQYLLSKKFVFTSLPQADGILSEQGKRKHRYVVFTFDDGCGTLSETLPLLEKYNIPATLFINSAYLDGNSMSWKDINNFIDKVDNPTVNPDPVKASLVILNNTEEPDTYNYFRKIVENSFSGIGINRKLFISRNELFALCNPLFSVGMHGHEHEHHTRMPAEWCRKNIQKNLEQLKNHQTFIPFIAFPFGSYNTDELEYWEGQGFKTLSCDGKLNYGNSKPLHRIAADGKAISLRVLARNSGESFSFKKLFKLKKV